MSLNAQIKLPLQQRLFARKIGATHVVVSRFNQYDYLINKNGVWQTFIVDKYFELSCPDRYGAVQEIDFTSEQEPDWKAIAQGLEMAMRSIVMRSNNGDLGSSKVGDMRKIAEQALQRAKEAGL